MFETIDSNVGPVQFVGTFKNICLKIKLNVYNLISLPN